MSFWRLFFTRKWKEEFGLSIWWFSPYNLVRTVIPWEPLEACKFSVWALWMHRSFVWAMFHEFRVSWLSLTHYTCASKLVCNSAADLRCSGTLRLTAKALCGLSPGSPELWIQNMDSYHYYFFSDLSVMISPLFSPSSCCSLYFHMISFSHFMLSALCIL